MSTASLFLEELSMRQRFITLAFAAVLSASVGLSVAVAERGSDKDVHDGRKHSVQLGPRPFFLVNDMQESRLKRELLSCSEGPFKKTDFSIGHRGAALQFPEHTRESYEAGARMGAGILECDVTLTKDLELVCRHAQNDLHTTTNILVTPLASQCTKPFTPAVFGPNGNLMTPASAECRTSDITLAEFKTLTGKMDASNPRALTPQEFLGGTPDFRTDLYASPSSGHLLTHKESIELFKKVGVKMTPELKSPSVTMPFNGFSQAAYAQKMIDEYKAAGVSPRRVFPQSFDKNDILYWIANEPEFGKQAVYLEDAGTPAALPGLGELVDYKQAGINIVGPPTFALLALGPSGRFEPSNYAKNVKAAGLDIITWTLERSGIIAGGTNDFYYQTIGSAIKREGDVLNVLDVLARDVGIRGIFSDWAATVTYYANCMGLK
jgi:glycerophosphoryl diester phosphodiesterase